MYVMEILYFLLLQIKSYNFMAMNNSSKKRKEKGDF